MNASFLGQCICISNDIEKSLNQCNFASVQYIVESSEKFNLTDTNALKFERKNQENENLGENWNRFSKRVQTNIGSNVDIYCI